MNFLENTVINAAQKNALKIVAIQTIQREKPEKAFEDDSPYPGTNVAAMPNGKLFIFLLALVKEAPIAIAIQIHVNISRKG